MRSHSSDPHDDRQSPQKSDMRSWLHNRCTSNYFTFDRRFLLMAKQGLRKMAGLFLQDLINVACLGVTAWDDDWFMCSTSYLEHFGWTRKEQEHALKNLVNAGFIRLKRKGIPAKRWVRVDTEAIDAALAGIQLHRNVQSSRPKNGVTDQPGSYNKNGTLTEYPNKEEKPDPLGGSGYAPHSARRTTTEHPAKERSTPPPATNEGDDPYIPEYVVGVADVDVARANRLREYVRGMGWRVSTSKKKWGVAAARLRRKLGSGHGLIDDVLGFLERKKLTKPSITSFDHLARVDVWKWVTDLAAKDRDDNPTVTVGNEAAKIAYRVRLMGWPPPVADQLPAVVQLSLNNLDSFRTAVAERYVVSERGFPRRVLTHFTDGFVERWFEGIRRWAKDKPNVRLAPKWVLSVDHDDFQRAGRQLANEYGRVSLWEDLMKEIGK